MRKWLSFSSNYLSCCLKARHSSREWNSWFSFSGSPPLLYWHAEFCTTESVLSWITDDLQNTVSRLMSVFTHCNLFSPETCFFWNTFPLWFFYKVFCGIITSLLLTDWLFFLFIVLSNTCLPWNFFFLFLIVHIRFCHLDRTWSHLEEGLSTKELSPSDWSLRITVGHLFLSPAPPPAVHPEEVSQLVPSPCGLCFSSYLQVSPLASIDNGPRNL